MRRSLISTDYLCCDTSDTLTSVMGNMNKQRLFDVLCYSGKTLAGTLDPHLLLKMHLAKKEKVKCCVRSVKRLSLSQDEKKTARDLLDNRCHILPVFEKRKLTGVVKAIDIVDALVTKKLGRVSLEAVATLRPLYFFEDTPLSQAMPLMRTHHVDHAPIVDKKLRLTGVVSVNDILTRYLIHSQQRAGGKNIRRPASRLDRKRPSGAVTMGSLASNIVASGKMTDTLRKAIDTMKKRMISSIILTDKKMVTGIVTIRDLLRIVAQ